MKKKGGILLSLLALLSLLGSVVWISEDIQNYIFTFIDCFVPPKSPDIDDDLLFQEIFIQEIKEPRYSEDMFTCDNHLLYKGEEIILTSDNKYYISRDVKDKEIRVRLWEAEKRPKEYSVKILFEFYTKFKYLERKNIILLFKSYDKTAQKSIMIYDVANGESTTVDFDKEVREIKIDSSETWCAIRFDKGICIGLLENIKTKEGYQFFSEINTLDFNLDADMFIGCNYDSNYIDLFSLQDDNTWKCVIKRYKLPFPGQFIHFMRDNYCIFYQSGRHGADGLLHVHINKCVTANGELFINVINGAGQNTIPRAVSKSYFAGWIDNETGLRIVGYDGSLIAKIDNFKESSSEFSHDEQYYIAQTFGIKEKDQLLIMSLEREQNKADILIHEKINDSLVKFYPKKNLFIQYPVYFGDSKLYTITKRGSDRKVELLRSVPGKPIHFGPDGHSIIQRNIEKRYELLPEKNIRSALLLLCWIKERTKL